MVVTTVRAVLNDNRFCEQPAPRAFGVGTPRIHEVSAAKRTGKAGKKLPAGSPLGTIGGETISPKQFPPRQGFSV